MTIDEIQKISDKTLSDRVASLCGWKPKFLGYEKDDGGLGRSRERYSKRPNYAKNLNAMHKVEGHLGHEHWQAYGEVLKSLMMDAKSEGGEEEAPLWMSFPFWHATARQRAEAFVLTMEEK